MAGGIAQGRQNPGLVSKAGGWVPSDSHLLSEPQVPAALSSRGHLPGLGMWLRSSVLLELAGLGLRRRVPVGKISGAHPPHPCFQRLGSALSISGPLCRITQNFHPVLPRQQAVPVWLSGQRAARFPPSLWCPFLREPGGLSVQRKSVHV